MKKLIIISILVLIIGVIFFPSKEEENNIVMDNLTYVDVLVKGEVKRPDSYSVPLGTKVDTVIRLAGSNEASVYVVDDPIIKRNMTVLVKTRIENPVNINRGIRNEISSLPGIGDVTLTKIMDYLEAHSFTSWEEFSKISGIRNAKLLEIKVRAVI